MKLDSLDMFVITELGFIPFSRQKDLLCYLNPETKSEWCFEEHDVCFSSSEDQTCWDMIVGFADVNAALLNQLKNSNYIPKEYDWSGSACKMNQEIIDVFEKLLLYFSETKNAQLTSYSD